MEMWIIKSTLPKNHSSPAGNRPSQTEKDRLPTMHFQGAFAVSFREGSGNMYLRKDLLAFLQFDLEVGLTNVNIIEIVATQKDLTVLTPNRAMFQNRLQYKMMMYISI